jgi:hypothetical protein
MTGRHPVLFSVLAVSLATLFFPPAHAAESTRAHPYLYFSAEDLPKLRERIKQPPFAERWREAKAAADGFLNAGMPGGGAGTNLAGARDAEGRAVSCAFAYALTGDKKYGEHAKKIALTLLNMPKWNAHDNVALDLANGHLSTACALVYDWCFDLLAADEKARFKQRLMELVINPYLKCRDWWIDNHVTNWAGVCHGGCGLAGLALYDEALEAKSAAEKAWPHVTAFLREVQPEDGGGHEGVMYHTYGVNYGLYFTVAAARLRGSDDGLFKELVDHYAGYWLIWMKGPDTCYANFNDMDEGTFAGEGNKAWERGPDAAQCSFMEAHVPGGDPLLLWGADHGGGSTWMHGASPFTILWRRDAPPAGERPSLTGAVLFRGNGHAVLNAPNLWFAYNGGWTSNMSHNNRDLGSFVLVAGGERFIHDPGYGKKGTADHSTLLVNGKGQEEGLRGTFPVFGSAANVHYLVSDLSTVYGGAVKRFQRHVVMVRGTYIVLLDDVTPSAPADMELRFQSTCSTTTQENVARLKGKSGELQIVSVAPADAKVSTGRGAIGFVGIRPGAQRAQETFVTILSPSAGATAKWDAGKLTVGGDTLIFVAGGNGWLLKSVNGEEIARWPSGRERTLPSFRKDDAVVQAKAATATAPKASVAKPVDPPPAPKVDEATQATWRARLRERLVASVKEGARPSVYLALMGPQPEKAKIIAADEKGLTVDFSGNKLPVPWAQIDGKGYLNLSLGCAREDDGQDQAVAGFFLLVEGRAADAEGRLARAALSGGDAKTWAEEVRLLLAR